MGELIPLFPVEPYERPPDPYWITLAKNTTFCDTCSTKIGWNRDMVYRHYPQSILCKECADKEGIEYLTSRRWREREKDFWGAA